ncbi:MAG: lytic transglycosylase domain-containing protein [Patescibacteria group bacterium]|nr:lytic transglycosylase domain-containing protein [Patescibacteria group bacterium]
MIKKIFIVLALLILAILTVSLYYFLFSSGIRHVYSSYMQFRFPLRYQEQIDKYSTEFGLEPALVSAVIYEESRFNPYSNSERGAIGLMQLLPETAEYISRKLKDKAFNPYKIADIDQNIRYGTYYLKYLDDKYGDLDRVLAAYNAGEGNVDRWITEGDYQIKFEETRNFVDRVKKSRSIYEKLYFKK